MANKINNIMSNILKFSELLKENIKIEEQNKQIDEECGNDDYRKLSYKASKNTFHLSYYPSRHNMSISFFGGGPYNIFKLDDEDIKYLSNKYLPRLQKEMEREVNKIKQRYGE